MDLEAQVNKQQMKNKLLEYFKEDELASNVFKSKYAQEGDITPDDMHKRLAKEFARIEKKYAKSDFIVFGDKNFNPDSLSEYGRTRVDTLDEETIYNLFKDFKYIIPQGSIMSNLGNKAITSLSNCFVVGQPTDSYGGICKKDEEMAQLMKRRGGVGLDISTLRPATTKVSNAAKSSTGAVSFMHRFSNTTREVAQDGRRGALMLSIDINHPDVMQFIQIKRDLSQVTGANISIKLNKEFMKAVERDEDYLLRFPCTAQLSEMYWEGNDTLDKGFEGFNLNELYQVYQGNSEKVYIKRIKAKEYWDEIIKSAHGVAEPGLMFWDNMIDYSPDGVYEEYKAITTNPCCFGESCRVDVITDKGIKDIRQVISKDLVWLQNENKFVPTKGYTNYGKAHTYKVMFSNGDSLILTSNHKLGKIISKRDGTKINKENFELVELSNLKVGDEIRIHNSESLSFGKIGTKEDGMILGWLSGDGCLSYANEGDTFPTMYLDFWQKEHDTADKMLEVVKGLGFNNTLLQFKNNGNEVKRIASSRLSQYFTEKFEINLWNFRKGRNEFLYSASKEFVQGYLSAYFTADGTIENVIEQSRFSISVSSIDLDRLNQVQSLLLNFGIRSSVGLLREKGSNNDYSYLNSQDCYRLTITGISNIRKFYNYIGFLNSYKQNKLESICQLELKCEKSLSYTKITSIEYHGIEEIGCIEVPNYHYFTANSIISGNSEIGMQEYDACRLIAVNLFGFVNNPFTPEAKFDFEKFYKINYEAMRLSDDLIDLELEHIDRILRKIAEDPEPFEDKRTEFELWEKIKKTAASSRRTGLGFTALGDTLAALGLKYDSEEALEVIEQIMSKKMESELDCTIDLAILRGTFDGWDRLKEYPSVGERYIGKNDFYEMISKNFPVQCSKMVEYGRRNVSWSTVAPTGTVSIMTQTTSGIEPLFMPFYMRRKKINPNDSDSRVDFVDQNGDKWQEFPILHPKFKDWCETYIKDKRNQHLEDTRGNEIPYIEDINDKEDLEYLFKQSPWYNSTANDIDWIKRVEIQGIIQKYITHSISSTINLPETVSLEAVSEIYKESWKKGLKGITVYRDGSRSGVLVSESTKDKQTFEQKDAPKRPSELPCEIHHPTIKNTKYTVIVGLLDSKPYEVFAIPYEVAKGYKNGFLSKTKSGVYNLIASLEEKSTIHTNLTGDMSDTEAALTRLISTSLRHGAEIKFIVEQLNKTHGDLFSFSKVIARVLKKYIPEGAKSTVKCQDCGSENVIFQEGCQTCQSCGSSKCG